MSEPFFGRTIVASVTPFDDDLNLDLNRAQELANRFVEAGIDAIAVCPTTGECPTVFYDDKIKLFEAVLEAVDGRCKTIAYVGDNCTQDTIDFEKKVNPMGFDGYLCVVPYYNKPPQEGLYRHFGSIAQATDKPIMLYNIPGRSVINMTAETTIRLATDYDNIIAIKEASGKMDQIAAIVKGTPDDFSVYSGDDQATLEIMGLGGVGVVSTIANVAPRRMKEIVELEAAGKHEEALKANEALLPLMDELFITSNPIMVKEALKLVGFSVGGLRLPLIPATPEQSAELAEVMRQCAPIH